MNPPDFRMDGRVALLTGAGRGIGLAMARAFAASGAAVAIQDIELEVAEAEAARIRDAGGRAIGLGGDITDLALPPTLVEQTIAQLGGLHILVNNAAIQKEVDWTEQSVDDIERQLGADLIAPIRLAQLVTPIFRAQRWGRIINLGSVQGRHGNPGMLPYSLAKAAIEKMTMALARSLGHDGVTVNCIAPGWMDNTHRNRHSIDDQTRARAGKHIPLGRMGQPEDCAGLAVLLCSPAGDYITGQTVYVDGGISAR